MKQPTLFDGLGNTTSFKKVKNNKNPIRVGQQGASSLMKEELERLNKLQSIVDEFNKKFEPLILKGEKVKFGDLEAAFSPEDYTTIKLIFKGKISPIIPFVYGRLDDRYLRKSIFNLENKIFKQNKLDKEAAEGVKEYEFNGGTIVGNAAIDRWQVFFDRKPDAGMIAKLKQNGFKWSPSNKSWQRFYHTTSIKTLEWVLGKIYLKSKDDDESSDTEPLNKDYVLAIAKYEGYELLNTPLGATALYDAEPPPPTYAASRFRLPFMFAELLTKELKKTELWTGVMNIFCTSKVHMVLSKSVVEYKFKSIHAYVDALNEFLKSKFQIKINPDYQYQLYDDNSYITIDIDYQDERGIYQNDELNARILGLRWQVNPPNDEDIASAKAKGIKIYESSNMILSEIKKGGYSFDSFFGFLQHSSKS